ncbi:MAG: dihydrofolate reductase family protein [Caldisericia bacterium]
MRIFCSIFQSLDGYIATQKHETDWIGFPFPQSTSGVEAVIMGRNTFEVVVQEKNWPYDVPVFVLSNSLSPVPAHLYGKMEIVCGDLVGIIRELEREGFNNIRIDGGKTIRSFLALGLIDEMIIYCIPVLLGSGIPLFGGLDKMMKLNHISTEVIDGSVVKSIYRREKQS